MSDFEDQWVQRFCIPQGPIVISGLLSLGGCSLASVTDCLAIGLRVNNAIRAGKLMRGYCRETYRVLNVL